MLVTPAQDRGALRRLEVACKKSLPTSLATRSPPAAPRFGSSRSRGRCRSRFFTGLGWVAIIGSVRNSFGNHRADRVLLHRICALQPIPYSVVAKDLEHEITLVG